MGYPCFEFCPGQWPRVNVLVRRDAERREKTPEPILQEIADPNLDKGVVLDRLKAKTTR